MASTVSAKPLRWPLGPLRDRGAHGGQPEQAAALAQVYGHDPHLAERPPGAATSRPASRRARGPPYSSVMALPWGCLSAEGCKALPGKWLRPDVLGSRSTPRTTRAHGQPDHPGRCQGVKFSVPAALPYLATEVPRRRGLEPDKARNAITSPRRTGCLCRLRAGGRLQEMARTPFEPFSSSGRGAAPAPGPHPLEPLLHRGARPPRRCPREVRLNCRQVDIFTQDLGILAHFPTKRGRTGGTPSTPTTSQVPETAWIWCRATRS